MQCFNGYLIKKHSKYELSIMFRVSNLQGIPNGGCILNYLLEKSRVVSQGESERNFHIFYQLLEGSDESLLTELGLVRDVKSYAYLKNEVVNVLSEDESENDKLNFAVTYEALSVCDFSDENRMVSPKKFTSYTYS